MEGWCSNIKNKIQLKAVFQYIDYGRYDQTLVLPLKRTDIVELIDLASRIVKKVKRLF